MDYNLSNNNQKEENRNTPPNVPDNKFQDFIKKYLLVGWDLLKIILIALVIVLPIRYFLFQPFIVKGESMVPNFQSGDYLIVDEISYRIGNPQRGDVVVLKYPLDPTQRYIKRIIGMPGETFEIQNGNIIISRDGKKLFLEETGYLPLLSSTDGNVKVTLEADEYFVLGDNRQFSYDSRRWGVLPRKDIIGKAIFRVFPLSMMTYISSPSY